MAVAAMMEEIGALELKKLTGYPWGKGGRKRRPLTLFSASFPHPGQGVSPAALNALAAAPGRLSLQAPGFSARITLDIL